MANKIQGKKVLTTDKKGPRLYQIAVMAVSELGGATRSIDTEDIAVKCHQLAPELFAWRKYPRQVNLELVRVSLSDAKKQRNGTLLSGSGRTGWRLTRKGLEWASRPTKGVLGAKSTSAARRTAGSIDTVRRTREIARIESSAAWKCWAAKQRIEESDARALFRVDSYATSQLVDIKVTRLLSLFKPKTKHHRFLEAAASTLNLNGNENA